MTEPLSLVPANKTYKIPYQCENCWKTSELTIPFGTLAAEYLLSYVCKNCGIKQPELHEWVKANQTPRHPIPLK